jgi:hypothetical protein
VVISSESDHWIQRVRVRVIRVRDRLAVDCDDCALTLTLRWSYLLVWL